MWCYYYLPQWESDCVCIAFHLIDGSQSQVASPVLHLRDRALIGRELYRIEIFPYAIMNQVVAWTAKYPRCIGGYFACSSLVLYGIREKPA